MVPSKQLTFPTLKKKLVLYYYTFLVGVYVSSKDRLPGTFSHSYVESCEFPRRPTQTPNHLRLNLRVVATTPHRGFQLLEEWSSWEELWAVWCRFVGVEPKIGVRYPQIIPFVHRVSNHEINLIHFGGFWVSYFWVDTQKSENSERISFSGTSFGRFNFVCKAAQTVSQNIRQKKRWSPGILDDWCSEFLSKWSWKRSFANLNSV